MTNVIRNTILSFSIKRRLLINWFFFLLLRNKKYAKKGTREFVQLGETAKINTFTVITNMITAFPSVKVKMSSSTVY